MYMATYVNLLEIILLYVFLDESKCRLGQYKPIVFFQKDVWFHDIIVWLTMISKYR